MPNRNIKESICTSETLDRLTAEEERLFYRLIVQCDDYGRMESHAQIVKSRCFPWKDTLKKDDVEAWLQGLHDSGAIILYEAGGKRYLELTGWGKYQRVRATTSKYPSPGEGVASSAADCGKRQQKPAKKSIPKVKPDKKVYGEFQNVLLTEEEYGKLKDKFGEKVVEEKITIFSEAMESKGYKYKSHYAAILSWNRRDSAKGNGNGTHRDDNQGSRTDRLKASVAKPLQL
jgi:hypothetical protein